MLKIYDNKADIPDALTEFYSRRSDGKYEPQIEGINSIGGLLAKRDELLEKVREIPGLKTKIADLEGQETLPAGKIAVDKTEFETMKSEHEAYTALGKIDDIKPKVEGFDELKEKDETRSREESYRAVAKASGFDEDKFVFLSSQAKPEFVLKSVSENGTNVDKYFVKTKDDKGKEIETPIADYVKESPTFKPFADSLTSSGTNGHKVIKQGTQSSVTPTIETEKEAVRASGAYAL